MGGSNEEERRSGTVGSRENQGGGRFSIARFNSFSDAVFAVAITLLVLSIEPFDIPGRITEAEALEGLRSVLPHFYAYALSFVIIGAFWVSHHRLFARFRVVDYRLLWMNLVYLMVVVFVPYPTGLLAQYGRTTTITALYAGSICLIGLLQALMCWYGARYHRAQGLRVDTSPIQGYLIASLTLSAVFLVSIGIAFLSPSAAKYFWLVLLPLGVLERRREARHRGSPPEGAEG
jgi:uncharacterized membrane protein